MSGMDPDIPVNLGQKRKLYNECVQYGISTNTPIVSEYIRGDDVDKLMNIDIACAKQDLKFVLTALTDEDILYVSRTIKQSTWIITDKKYATIINPEYLQAQLLPKMTAKAANKFLKHIRLHLKDENRVEAFYKNEKNVKKALKWLPNCSISFIELEVTKHAEDIEIHLLKRLSEKSTSIWKNIIKHKGNENRRNEALKSTLFILYKNTDLFLDLIEDLKWYELPKLEARGTEVVMKSNSQRVLDKLKDYLHIIDIPTFIKNLKAEQVKDVMYKIAEEFTKNHRYFDVYYVFSSCNLERFLYQMPIDERYKFVKAVFIDKIHTKGSNVDVGSYDHSELNKMAKVFSMCTSVGHSDYIWYQFLPFEEAFDVLKERIRKETDQYERNSMLKTLLDCARSNVNNRKAVLQYFNDKHINDKLIDKTSFIYDFLSSKIPIYKYDEISWGLLNEIFKSMDVYKESVDVSENIIEAIIVHTIIKNEPVPEIIEKKFVFKSLKEYGNQMSQSDKDKLFNYVYNYSLTKVNSRIVEDEDSFQDKVTLLYDVLLTLKDWEKDLAEFPIVLDKIRECIHIKNKNGWKTNLSKFYNINKSWKKHMFEESMSLNPSEEVCLNALKHDAGLLKRNASDMLLLTRNDNVTLRRVLSKMRIFWCHTLAKDWTDEYLSRLNQDEGLQAVVRGLCAILPQDHLQNIIKAYAPEESEINWEQTDSAKVALQRYIAKNMHTARPQPSPDSILLYAKGDYLQFALPSVLSIFNNLSQQKTREYIPRLFDAPVSLQKHGLRLAVTKMQHQDVIDIFNNIWISSKSLTIRAVIIKLTIALLSKEKNSDRVKELWNFLAIIIDHLSFEEDSSIYELLGKAEEIPISIRAQYVEKSYIFFKKMLSTTSGDDRKNIENYMKQILVVAEKIMHLMCPKFVSNLLLEYIEELNEKPADQILHKNIKIYLLSTFLLTAKTEDMQIEKFKNVCVPFIKCSEKPCHKTLIPRLQFFLRQSFLDALKTDNVTPEIIFSQLYNESIKVLPVCENYVVLTEMKLFAALLKILKNQEKDDLMKMLNFSACEFGKVCIKYLKEDIDAHFPLIYNLFSRALNNVYTSLQAIEDSEKSIRNSFCSSMLQDKDFVPGYLVALNVYSSNSNVYNIRKKSENTALLKLILENESVEVRMHYYSNIGVSCEAF